MHKAQQSAVGQGLCISRPGVFPGGGVYPWSLCLLRSWKILSEVQAATYFWTLWGAYPEASACWDWKAPALWGFVCSRSQLKELRVSNSYLMWRRSPTLNASRGRLVHICGYLKSYLNSQRCRRSGLSRTQNHDDRFKTVPFQDI